MAVAYDAPLAWIRAAIDQCAPPELRSVAPLEEAFGQTADAILEGIARLARDVLAPLNPVGDAAPSQLTAAGVVTPPGFREAYRRFCVDGWPTLCAPSEFGGQGLPMLLGAAATETWGGANLAFAMCPEAATGAVVALRSHAGPDLKARYLASIVSGEWTASMCLTEPQSGSDLSTLRTLAEPDGTSWRLRGRKIYISWGEHDLSENIVHLVLARTPNAPAGLKGISLFLVPKRLLGEGEAHEANDIAAISLEHKMGIRASPTCVMALGEHGGARGWLVGPLHQGVACLFAMMNHMRIGVGLHSTGLAERAWQLARAYATERRQGRDASGTSCPIIEHADVRRMLLTMRTLTHAARCLAYQAAALLDLAHADVDAARRECAERRLGLLTPLVKAWCSDIAVEVASLGVQVHGGTGYVDDSEISQVYRDARIGPIFEGTNYIQAQDLLVRKVLRDGGTTLAELLSDVQMAAQRLSARMNGSAPVPSSVRTALCGPLIEQCSRLRAAVRGLAESSRSNTALAGSVAYPFLQWLAVVAGGWQWALAAENAAGVGTQGTLSLQLIDCARFYGAHILPRALTYEAQVASGSDMLITPHRADL